MFSVTKNRVVYLCYKTWSNANEFKKTISTEVRLKRKKFTAKRDFINYILICNISFQIKNILDMYVKQLIYLLMTQILRVFILVFHYYWDN